MERYYVRWSSIFNTIPYDIDLIKKSVKRSGGKNIRTSKSFGWSNQPEVVTFSCDNLYDVKTSLQKDLNTEWVIVLEKDW